MRFSRYALLATILLPFVHPAPLARGYEINWHSIDGGGACPANASVGGTFELSGTIGQPDAGTMATGTMEVVGGFWEITSASIVPQPGDCDADGDLDLDDYACFAGCMSGPNTTPPGSCEDSDMDADGDVDLLDFAAFGAHFGP